MSASLPGGRELPASRHDLGTYWGRVRQAAEISDPRTLLVSAAGLERAKSLVSAYKSGSMPSMTPELWDAKKVLDATLHPDTGKPVFLPFRMSCFVLSNLVVTAGMLTPGLGTFGIIAWQVTNQSLNVAINTANANKSSPLSTRALAQSYCLAVSASVGVAVGLNALVPRLRRLSPQAKVVAARLVPFAAVASAGFLNVCLMRSEEVRTGIDVYAVPDAPARDAAAAPVTGAEAAEHQGGRESLGKSRAAAALAVGETAASRVINATPIMVLPPLALVRLQRSAWLRARPGLTLPVNLGLILSTSLLALPLALGVFPQRQAVRADSLEDEFHGRGGKGDMVEFNRGI